MATNGQLRRAVAYALDNGWRRDGSDTVFRVWSAGVGYVRAIEVCWDALHRRVLWVRELDMMDGRNVSIRRAITVLTATYDDHGQPFA